jgi:ABC-2 type transport system permease protein
VLTFCAVATGAAVLVGVALRTAGQAAAVGPPVGIVLGMLGGCMWPLEAVGDGLRTVGRLTPHAWAMDALLTLQTPDGGLDRVGTELAVLTAMAAALLALAIARYRRSIIG